MSETQPYEIFKTCQASIDQNIALLKKFNEENFCFDINSLDWDDVSHLAFYQELIEKLILTIQTH